MNTAPHPAASFTDTSVQPGQTYFYMTTAVDKKGRESKFSNRVQVTLPNS
jgi:fibronectin type 3 domain-containing protein